MAEHRANPPADIPEADILEQHTPVDVDELTDDQGATAASPSGSTEANEADVLEQSGPLPGEEDHPHGPADAREP